MLYRWWVGGLYRWWVGGLYRYWVGGWATEYFLSAIILVMLTLAAS